MKIALSLLAVVLALLAVAAGIAKVMLVPQEAEFLGQFGFNSILIMGFGVIQVLGGVLLAIPRTRYQGALITAAVFALSAGLVLASGDLIFAAVSLVPVLLVGFIAYQGASNRRSRDADDPAV